MLAIVLFTKNSGDPATALTLADIDIYLYSRAKSNGAVAAVWSGENPTEEVGGGIYTKNYATADEITYDYFAYAEYTGGTTLDSNYALQSGVMVAPVDVIADETLKRGVANVEDTADPDSLAAMILAALHSSISGTTWTIKKTDDATTFDTKDVTVDSLADPITGVADP